MDRLIQYIEHYYNARLKKVELTDEQQEELDFLERINSIIKKNGKDALMEIDIYELVVALLCSSKTIKPYREIKELISKLKLSGIPNYETIFTINDYFKESDDLGVLEEFFFLPYDYDTETEEVKKIIDSGFEKSLKEVHSLLKTTFCPDEEARDTYFGLLDQFGVDIVKALVVVGAINYLKFESSKNRTTNNNNTFKDFSNMFNMNQGFNTSFIRQSNNSLEAEHDLNFMLHITNALDSLDSIENRIKTLKKVTAGIEKENSIIKKRKERIIGMLKSLDLNKPIDLSKSTLDSFVDESIKYIILRFFLMHNLTFQNETISRLEKEENISKIEKLFKKSCFSFNKLDKDQKMNLSLYGNIDDIEKMMTLFTESGLKIYNDSFPIYDILLLSKPSMISTINKMISSNVISAQFVLENPSIFVKEIDDNLKELVNIKDAKYETIINNINLMKDNKIDVFVLSKSRSKDALLKDEDSIAKILSVINSYNLNYSSSNDFSIFNDPKLVMIADRFIELGLSDFIRNNPKLLNEEAFKYLDRMDLCRELGIDLITDGKLSPKVTGPCFKIGRNIISDNEIKEFIPNAVNRYMNDNAFKALYLNSDYSSKEEEIVELERFSNGKLEYNINGIIISKQKVLRNLYVLNNNKDTKELSRKELIFNAIIFGSTLDEEKLNILSNSLDSEYTRLEKKNYS